MRPQPTDVLETETQTGNQVAVCNIIGPGTHGSQFWFGDDRGRRRRFRSECLLVDLYRLDSIRSVGLRRETVASGRVQAAMPGELCDQHDVGS